MIELNGINVEYPTITHVVNLGYEQQLSVKIAISGREHTDTIGKRLVGEWSYVWLTNSQIEQLYSLIDAQKDKYIFAKITTAQGLFEGNVYVGIDDMQKRYVKNSVTNEYVWIGYSVKIRAVDLI